MVHAVEAACDVYAAVSLYIRTLPADVEVALTWEKKKATQAVIEHVKFDHGWRQRDAPRACAPM